MQEQLGRQTAGVVLWVVLHALVSSPLPADALLPYSAKLADLSWQVAAWQGLESGARQACDCSCVPSLLLICEGVAGLLVAKGT